MFNSKQAKTIRRFSPFLLLFAAASLQAQPNPADNPMGGTGSITSQNEFKREIRNANNTGVEGTEFFKLTYSCTWQLVRTDDTDDKTKQDCVLKCNGRKHIKHSDCDTSCDTPCPVHVHRFSFSGHTDYLTKAMRQAERDADNLVVQAGGDPYGANWTSYYTRSLSNAKRMSEQVHNYAVPCWNTDPCSVNRRYYGLRKYEFRITGTLTENGYYMSRGVKTPYAARNRGSHTATVANVWLPDDEPLATAKSWNCKCKPVPIKDDPKAGDPPIRENWDPPVWGGYLIWDDDDNDIELPNDLVKLLITGIDLNRVHIEVVNESEHGITVVIGGGILLVPNDDKYQAMTIMVQTRLVVPAHSTKTADPRAACTEMNKREPTTSTIFTIAQDLNPTLADLAAITNAARFRGATDQARVWIVTDHAPYAEIKKHLIPGPSQGQYLNALYDVSRANGIDINTPEFKDCFDSSLLVSTTAKREAATWMVQQLDRMNPGALTDLANNHAAEITEKLGEKAGDSEIKYVSNLIKNLCSCSSAEGRMAGLSLLLKAVPAAQRDKIAQEGGLDAVIVSTQSEDPKEQAQALEVIDEYNHKPAADEVNKLAALGASDEVKQKAAAVAKKLGS